MLIGVSEQTFELKYSEKMVKQGAVVINSFWEFTAFQISSYQNLLHKLQQTICSNLHFFWHCKIFHIQRFYLEGLAFSIENQHVLINMY